MPQKDWMRRESFSNELGSFGSESVTEEEEEELVVLVDLWLLATVTPTATPTAMRMTSVASEPRTFTGGLARARATGPRAVAPPDPLLPTGRQDVRATRGGAGETGRLSRGGGDAGCAIERK